MKWFALFFASFMGFMTTANAQRYEVGTALGASVYVGDLVPGSYLDYFKNFEPAVGLFGRMNMGQRLSFRLGYNYLTLSANDDLKSNANFQGLMFRTRVHELNISAEVNLFRLHFNEEQYLSPYLLVGGGFFNFNPKAIYDPVYARNGGTPSRPELLGQWIELQPLGTEGQGLDGYGERYSLTRGNILAGGGLKYRVSQQWMIGLEAVGRLTYFDYLDDVGEVTMVYGDILAGNGVLAAEMSKPRYDPSSDSNLSRSYFRGGDADDYYLTMTVTVSYLFGGDVSGGFGGGGRVKCPTF